MAIIRYRNPFFGYCTTILKSVVIFTKNFDHFEIHTILARVRLGGRQDTTAMMVCAIIHTQNSSEHIESIVLRARALLEPDIYVLDDNSSDDTIAIAQNAGAKILASHDSKGSIVEHALRLASQMQFSHAILMNANDPTHAPEHIRLFINAIWDNPHRIYVAVDKKSRKPSMANALLTASALRAFKAPWNRFRVYPIEGVLALNCKESGENFSAEALVRASWAGIYTTHIELESPSHFCCSQAPNTNAIWFGMKLFGEMLIRFPAVLRRRFVI